MKVIGAAFGRTGTMSLKVALEELGLDPFYHAVELFENPRHAELWGAAARGEPVDWDELLGDYQSTVDWPGCAFYKELMQECPDAKVLLSVRDPERWYESTANTIYGMRRGELNVPDGTLDVGVGFRQRVRRADDERDHLGRYLIR